jgi:hypothetical protein
MDFVEINIDDDNVHPRTVELYDQLKDTIHQYQDDVRQCTNEFGVTSLQQHRPEVCLEQKSLETRLKNALEGHQTKGNQFTEASIGRNEDTQLPLHC